MKKRGRFFKDIFGKLKCLPVSCKLPINHSSQLIGFDLIFGVLILILGIAFTLKQIDKISASPTAKLNLQSDFVFNNLELSLKNKKYFASTGFHEFIGNFNINEEELKNFQGLPYDDEDGDDFNDIKSIALKALSIPNLNLDFCLYFENKTGYIIPIQGKTGIGSSGRNSKIYVGEKNSECNQIVSSEISLKAAPECSDYYDHASNVFKPVIRQRKIMKMNILICAKESK